MALTGTLASERWRRSRRSGCRSGRTLPTTNKAKESKEPDVSGFCTEQHKTKVSKELNVEVPSMKRDVPGLSVSQHKIWKNEELYLSFTSHDKMTLSPIHSQSGF